MKKINENNMNDDYLRFKEIYKLRFEVLRSEYINKIKEKKISLIEKDLVKLSKKTGVKIFNLEFNINDVKHKVKFEVKDSNYIDMRVILDE